jgi:hypothetical protein
MPSRGRRPDPGTLHSGYVPRADVALVVGVVGGPLAVLLGLQGKYTVAQLWACGSGIGAVAVHLVALATLLLAAGCGVLAHRQWRGAGREDPGDLDGREGRTRVLAAIGVGMSALSALFIVSQWLPQLFIHPCQP